MDLNNPKKVYMPEKTNQSKKPLNTVRFIQLFAFNPILQGAAEISP